MPMAPAIRMAWRQHSPASGPQLPRRGSLPRWTSCGSQVGPHSCSVRLSGSVKPVQPVCCISWLSRAGGIGWIRTYRGVWCLVCHCGGALQSIPFQCASAPAAATSQTSSWQESASSVDSQQGAGASGLPPHLSWLMGDEDKPRASATEAAAPDS